MNIAFVNSTKKWGGVKTWTLEFAARLQQAGNYVYIYGRQPEFIAKAQNVGLQSSNVTFGPDFNPLAILFFLREFKKHKIETVVLNVGKDLATAGLAAKMLGLPIVQRIGLPNDIAPKAKAKWLHKILNPYFLCPCEFIADGFCACLPWVNNTRVKVILNGKTPSDKPVTANTPRKLIVTQQINPDKDHKTLLRALSMVKTPFMLEIVGRGSCENELKALAHELGLQDKIIWRGFSSNVEELLGQADIFLLASLCEGLPNTLLEALSVGLLPICRNVGGVKEVWPDELDKWLLPFEANAETFGRAIEHALALSDEELLAAKHIARRACTEHCNIEVQAALLERWLREIVKK